MALVHGSRSSMLHRRARAAAAAPCRLAAAPCRRVRQARAGPEDGRGEDLSDLLKDLERFQQRGGGAASSSGGGGAPAATKAAAPVAGGGGASSSGEQQQPSALKETLDKVLIADFFFVLAILGWLGAGLGANALGSSALLDAWFPLWPLVFQPAIGVLMLGALVSGGLGWLKEQGDKKKAGGA